MYDDSAIDPYENRGLGQEKDVGRNPLLYCTQIHFPNVVSIRRPSGLVGNLHAC